MLFRNGNVQWCVMNLVRELSKVTFHNRSGMVEVLNLPNGLYTLVRPGHLLKGLMEYLCTKQVPG